MTQQALTRVLAARMTRTLQNAEALHNHDARPIHSRTRTRAVVDHVHLNWTGGNTAATARVLGRTYLTYLPRIAARRITITATLIGPTLVALAVPHPWPTKAIAALVGIGLGAGLAERLAQSLPCALTRTITKHPGEDRTLFSAQQRQRHLKRNWLDLPAQTLEPGQFGEHARHHLDPASLETAEALHSDGWLGTSRELLRSARILTHESQPRPTPQVPHCPAHVVPGAEKAPQETQNRACPTEGRPGTGTALTSK